MDLSVTEIREYTAMALLGASWMAFVSLTIWIARRFVGRGLLAFNGIRNAIEALTVATLENTRAVELHRNESIDAVERISREIRESRK